MPEIRYRKIRRYAADGTLIEEIDVPHEVSDEEIVVEEAEQALSRALELDDPKLAAVAVAAKERPDRLSPGMVSAVWIERELSHAEKHRVLDMIQEAETQASSGDLLGAFQLLLNVVRKLIDLH